MNSKRFLIKIQFLGFRFHGVQKQPGFLSVQGRVEEALQKKFPQFQTRFASRTDAMVSALETYFLLMFDEEKNGEDLQLNLPADIRVLEIKAVDDKFTMLEEVKEKEYRYYFSFGEDQHPFSAPFMTHLQEELDINLMQEAAELFVGIHNFSNYVHKPKTGTVLERTIFHASIEKNTDLVANFFPQRSFVFSVRAKSFMRGQVRLMMGALLRVGMKELSISDFKESLQAHNSDFKKWMAPPAGLILSKTLLE